MFGINVRFLSHTHFDAFPFTLVQVMDSLLMQSIMDFSSISASQNTMLQLPAIYTESNITFFPDIGKGMRNLWCQVETASHSSTKADAAVTDMKLWDLRIMPVLNQVTPKLIHFFRKFLIYESKEKVTSKFL